MLRHLPLALLALLQIAALLTPAAGVTLAQYPPLGGDARSGPFALVQDSTLWAAGAPPDEVQCWGYNVAPGTGPVLVGESVLAECIEGHYEPYLGVAYTEYQLRYVTPAGDYQRPVEIRINKTSGEIIQAYSASGLWLRTPDDAETYQTFAPGTMGFHPAAGHTGSAQFVNGDTAFQIQGGGPARPLLINEGWSYAALPGMLVSPGYTQVSGSFYLNDQVTGQPCRITVRSGVIAAECP